MLQNFNWRKIATPEVDSEKYREREIAKIEVVGKAQSSNLYATGDRPVLSDVNALPQSYRSTFTRSIRDDLCSLPNHSSDDDDM